MRYICLDQSTTEMTAERWQQIEKLYHDALEQPPDKRSAYLARVCPTDELLRAEVESLLHRDASAPELLLNRPPAQAFGVQRKPGQRLGPYELESPIGAGGMGEVWKARDTRLDRPIALKFSKRDFTARFEREARAVAALNHPHIAALYDVGANYFVMEYVDGKPLQFLLPRKGLPVAQALTYAAQIADALSAAHAAHIVHRDLKPGNIMITTDGRVKVVDFGLARMPVSASQSADASTLTHTAEGTIAGTVSYMSPEQAQGREVDARSDIFSFGAVLYEMLTGTRAFAGDSTMSILADIINKDPRPVIQVDPDLPRELERLLNRCLRKDPARRWQNMADVKVALQELKEESDSGNLFSVRPAPPKRTRLSLWLTAIAALALTGATAGWYFWRDRSPTHPPLTAVPLTSYRGMQVQPAFSPDGNQVAFSWDGPQRDNWDIYVKVVGEGDPLRLTSDPAADRSPSWSPDGRWVAFARDLTANRYALILISPLGGPERKLGEFEGPDSDSPLFAWSTDSRQLILSIRSISSQRNGLFRLSLDTGDLVQMTRLDTRESGDNAPALSPDGRRLAFKRGRAWSLADLYVVNVANDLATQGPPRLVTSGLVGRAAWTPDGKELIFPSGPTVTAASLRRISVDGSGVPEPVSATGDNAYSPVIARTSAGSARLAWAHNMADANIYRMDISSPDHAGEPQPVIASLFRDVFPQYSRDGKSIAFYSARGGNQEVWVCNADGSSPRQLTRMGGPAAASPRWSPDGRRVAFDSDKGGTYQVYIISADGGAARRMTEPGATNFGPNWSLDGRTLYFSSNRNGVLNVWKMPVEGGPAQQVTHDIGANPTVSPDGKFLYFIKPSNSVASSLWRVPVEGGNESMVVPRIHRFSYAVTPRGIYYSAPGPTLTDSSIEFFDPVTSRHAILRRSDKVVDSGVAVSPDGRDLLFPQIDNRSSNLMMIENFR